MLDKAPQDRQEAEAVIRLAKLFMQYGLDERAYSVLWLADWLSPGNLNCRELQAEVLAKLGRWDEAIAVLLDLQARRRATQNDHHLLAKAYWAKGEREKGDKAFQASFSAA